MNENANSKLGPMATYLHWVNSLAESAGDVGQSEAFLIPTRSASNVFFIE